MVEKLVTIATFSEPMEAHLCQAKLEAEGVESYIADEHTIGTNWFYTNIVGGVKLQVRSSDVENAARIIQKKTPDIDADFQEFEPEPDEEKKKPECLCPQCKSTDVYFERFSRRFAFLSILFLRFPLPVFRKKWKCNDCGYEWKARG